MSRQRSITSRPPGEENWPKMDEVIRRVEEARAEGLRITADMYTYTAGATGLDAAMPPWAQEGGPEEWYARLRDPELRPRIAREMVTPTDEWENLILAAGGPENVLLVGFKQDSLKYLTGKTLAEVSEMRGTDPPRSPPWISWPWTRAVSVPSTSSCPRRT